MRDLQIIHHRGVLFEGVIAAFPRRLLQQFNGKRVVHMVFCCRAGTEPMRAYRVQCRVNTETKRLKSLIVLPLYAFADFFHADAFDTTYGFGKVAVNDFSADADTFENLCSLIRLNR